MICPGCNSNGFICKMKIIDLNKELFSCGKCTVCWTVDQANEIKKFISLSAFLKEHGLQYGDAEIGEITLVCQMCDGQGEIYNIKIPELGLTLRICNHCEACWTPDQMITMETSKKLSSFLSTHHLKNKDIKMLDKVILCPRCDGQGEIYNIKVIDLGIALRVCKECEASWKENQPITSMTFQDLGSFLEKNGLKYGNTKLEIL